MVVLKLKSPLVVVALALVALLASGLALLRVDTAWVMRAEIVVTGGWGGGSGEFGRGAGADGRPRGPQALAADKAGNVVVADSLNYRLQIFDRQGRLLEVVSVPMEAASLRTEDDRAAVYARVNPTLDWGYGFRPRPDISAPARVPEEAAEVTAGKPGPTSRAATSSARPPYITDIDLSGAVWKVDDAASRIIDPSSGPALYLLAGWEGIIVATDATGNLKWSRDLSTPERFLNLPDPSQPNAPPEPEAWAGYLLDLDAFPSGEGLIVSGYELQPDKLVYFVRFLARAEDEPKDLAGYELVQDGSVRITEGLPVGLEVESVAVASGGLLYVVAAEPAPDVEGAGGGAGVVTPFVRDVYIFTREGQQKGKLELDCGTYTRHLRLVGVDERGFLFTRLGGPGTPGSLVVFDGTGRKVADAQFPEEAEVADAYLARDGRLYVSVATGEGYQVFRFTVGGQSRLAWRWSPS